MPQALDVDYTQAKLIYAATGSLKTASEQTGISYAAIRQRASREQWEESIQEAQKAVSHRVTEALGTARNKLEELNKDTRLKLAKGINSGATAVSELSGAEVLAASGNVASLAKAAASVHGWSNQSPGVNIRLDVIAQSQSDVAPTLDGCIEIDE